MAETTITSDFASTSAVWKRLEALVSSRPDSGLQVAKDMSVLLQELIAQASHLKTRVDGAIGVLTQSQEPDALAQGVVIGFKTEKGSTYQVTGGGQTVRDKAYRPEHGVKEQGIQPISERTVYVSKQALSALAEFKLQQNHSKRLVLIVGNQIGIQYLGGERDGKFEKRSITGYSSTPEVGLIPVELWNDGRRVHFGNAIVEVSRSPQLGAGVGKIEGMPVGQVSSMRSALATCGSRLMQEASDVAPSPNPKLSLGTKGSR